MIDVECCKYSYEGVIMEDDMGQVNTDITIEEPRPEGMNIQGNVPGSDSGPEYILRAHGQKKQSAKDLVQACSELKVSHIMTKELVTISGVCPVEHILELFDENHFHTLPVVSDKGQLIGIIDQNIILGILLVHRIPKLDHTHLAAVKSRGRTAKDIMIPHPVVISADLNLCDTADMMLKHRMDRFCVVRDDRLVGIICKSDVIKEVYRLKGLI